MYLLNTLHMNECDAANIIIKWICCINISITAQRYVTCIPPNKWWFRAGLPSATSLQIRLQRDTLAVSLVTGGALWSCNQEPSSWMCSPTMWPYKLRYPLKCEKRRIGTLSGWLHWPLFFKPFSPHFSLVFSPSLSLLLYFPMDRKRFFIFHFYWIIQLSKLTQQHRLRKD